MNGDVEAFRHTDDPSAYPADFLAAYEPLACLAHGAAGETLIVRGREDDGLYIAKVLPEGAGDEGRLLEALSHPALPRFVGRYGDEKNRVLVREYVRGKPLDEAMAQRTLTQAQVVEIGVQLCEVLCYLHRQRPPIIHRDIKPQNLILGDDGRVTLIDFGIARTYKKGANHDTVFSGTNEFAPPEQYGFAQTDQRADIYSLGMLLKYLLTGGDAEGFIKSRRLRRVVKRCTAFSPQRRYASVARVRRALLMETLPYYRRASGVLAAAMLLLGVLIGRFAVPFAQERIAEVRAEATGLMQEYARDIEYGFIPEALRLEDPDKTIVTWSEYCAMLGSMIAAYDETLLPKWEELTAAAPDTEMKRDGGMMALLFAAELMGRDSFNAPEPEGFLAYSPKVWLNVTMDYPVFDFRKPKEITRDCYDDNYVGPSYDFCLRRVSSVSGKSLMEFDEKGDLRLSEPFTLREAAQAVLRLYESEGGI